MNDMKKLEPEGGTSIILNDGTPVDMKTLQGIYNEFTGRTEKLGKYFKDPHLMQFADIEQLLLKLQQSIQQYDLKGSSCVVLVFFSNANRARFSSFEKFRQFDTSSTNPTEGIDIQFTFLAMLPETKKVQNYKVNITFFSRAAIRSKEAAAHGVEAQLLDLTNAVTGRVEIEYIDYSVARFLLTTIEDWYSSVKKSKPSVLAKLARATSRWHSDIFRISSMIVFGTSVYFQAEKIFPPGAPLHQIAIASFICLTLLLVISHVAYAIGEEFESTLDLLTPVSALSFNKGDTNIIEAYKTGNVKIIVGAIGFLLAQVGISILATWGAGVLDFTSAIPNGE